VEWADRVLGLLPQDAWLIRIEPVDTTRRRVSLEVPAQAASAIEQLLVASC
jgi:tRNA A37 threonylcarbamoyladenosine biosynthesis protein TsaE